MRRLKAEAERLKREKEHEGYFLDDLLKDVEAPLQTLAALQLVSIARRTPEQEHALEELWNKLLRLSTTKKATCVGITKAILLLTYGRIGPAFDSQVRQRLRLAPFEKCSEWIRALEGVAEDITAFEQSHGPIIRAVPSPFDKLDYGRLYDMALGPR
jgi:hypothetical protein